MMSLPFGLFTQVSGLGPLGPLVYIRQEFLRKYKLINRFHIKVSVYMPVL